jgi:hypothetical protein
MSRQMVAVRLFSADVIFLHLFFTFGCCFSESGKSLHDSGNWRTSLLPVSRLLYSLCDTLSAFHASTITEERFFLPKKQIGREHEKNDFSVGHTIA